MLMLLCLAACSLSAEIVQIGNGDLLNQCLPVEPVMNYSYSQSIYTDMEIGSAGFISAVGFQYRINGNNFLPHTNLFSIYMGTVSRDRYHSLTDWVPLDSLQLVFQDSLRVAWFSTTLPGQGWLMIPLESVYNYSANGNLVIAVDENMPGSSSSGDDFYCTASAFPQSIEIHSMTVNPDPAAPPPAYNNNPYNPLAVKPNLKLEMQPVIFAPHSPVPADAATEIALDTSLNWQSNATSWDVLFAQANQTLQTVASGLPDLNWTPSAELALLTQYHWQVVAHISGDEYPSPVWTFTTRGEILTAPQNLQAITIGMQVRLQWQPPAQGNIVSYRIYRDQQYLNETQETEFFDTTVQPDQTYWYYVVAVNYLNQVSPPSNPASVTIPGSLPVWQMSFDDQADFALSIPEWTMYDLDNSPTWQWSNTSFLHEGNAMSWIVFNPSQTTPPVMEVLPHNGNKMLLCISSTNPPNNDWLISPRLSIQNGFELSFWVRSYTSDYGLERLRFLVSTTDSLTTSFLTLSTEPWLAVPAQWTQISYDLSAYAGQQIYLAWQCVSWDAFALCLDDITITQAVSNNDETQAPNPTFRIYPNPAQDRFQVESSDKTPYVVSIFNTKGQQIFQQRATESFEWNNSLPAGLYLIRISQNNSHICKKLVVY